MDHSTLMAVPDGVLQRILGMLPFSCMLRAKIVCKRWNAMLSSPTFLRSMPFMPMSSHPWFFIFTLPQSATRQLQFSGYDPLSETWHSFHIPRTPANYNTIDSVDEFDRFIVYDCPGNDHRLTMCNPFAKLPWAELSLPPYITFPDNERYPQQFTSFSSYVAASSTILVLARCLSGFSSSPVFTVDIYDSNPINNKAWRGQQICTVPELEPLHNAFICNVGVLCNGVLYFVLKAQERNYIMAYHLSNNSLTDLLMIPRPYSSTSIILTNCGERLMMVKVILKTGDGTVEGIGIWQLQLNEGIEDWARIGTMSQQNFTRFNASRFIITSGGGDLIYFTIFQESSLQLLIFNVLQRAWKWSTPYEGVEAHPYRSGILSPRL